MTQQPIELDHALPEPLIASATADGSTPPRYSRAWRTRRKGILDAFDEALCAAAGLPDGEELPEVTREDYLGNGHPTHNLD